MATFEDVQQWKLHTVQHWEALQDDARKWNLATMYQHYLAILFLPLLPQTAEEAVALAQFLDKASLPGGEWLKHRAAHFQEPLTIENLVTSIEKETTGYLAHIRHALFQDGALAATAPDNLFDIILSFLQDVPASRQHISAERITSEHDVIIAGRDVYTDGKNPRDALKAHLSDLRAQWNYLDFSSIVPDPIRHLQTRLHQLYAPLDVWSIPPSDAGMGKLRQLAVEQELEQYRISTVKVANDSARLVITGGPGTGKSTVCGFLTTGLAYACDADAERYDGIQGLELLGNEWQQGPLLPVYVRLRHFASDAAHFPKKLKNADCMCLLNYLKSQIPDFNTVLLPYFKKRSDGINGVLLMFDGLDEIYNPGDRHKAKKIIEHFAESFPGCRILVTCRSAAYQPNMKWYLTAHFDVMELAPYTWDQVSQYVRNWYHSAVDHRPMSLGGQDVAAKNAKKYAHSLIQTLKFNATLWSLARQPLLLTLMVLIHEENRHLPRNRAELYEKTVNLLHKWNPPDEDDPLASKLQQLNYQRVREVLQLTAFNAQRDRVRYKDNEANIKRPHLIDQLLQGDGDDNRLGGLSMMCWNIWQPAMGFWWRIVRTLTAFYISAFGNIWPPAP